MNGRKVVQVVLIFVMVPILLITIDPPPGMSQDPGMEKCEKFKSGLTGYWPLESPTNRRVVDRSGLKNHGRTVDANYVSRGQFGHSLYLDGFGDFVAIPPDDSIRPSLPLTVSFWMKMYSLPLEMNHHVKFLSWKIRDQQTGWHIWSLKHNNQLQALSGDGKAFHRLKSVDPLQKDRWYHIAFRRTRKGGSLFIDGFKTDVDYDQVKLPDKKFLGLRIGGWDQRHTLNGLIDEIRLYKKELSDKKIQLLSKGRCAKE